MALLMAWNMFIFSAASTKLCIMAQMDIYFYHKAAVLLFGLAGLCCSPETMEQTCLSRAVSLACSILLAPTA